MIIDGIQLTEGGEVSNFTLAGGLAFPDSPVTGELFVLTADILNFNSGLYVNLNGTWFNVLESLANQIAYASATGLNGTTAQAALDEIGSMFNVVGGQIIFKGDLVPDNTNSLSIGSVDKVIKDLFISANTIHMGDNTVLSGTSITVDAGDAPDSIGDMPTVVASKLVARPFTYNAGAGDITVRPSIEFQDENGVSNPISFNSATGEFSLDLQGNYGQGALVGKKVTLSNPGFDVLDLEGNIDLNGSLVVSTYVRVDGNVDLGYDASDVIKIRGTLDIDTPVVFGEGATLGDGNDNIHVNSGVANTFTVTAGNVVLDASGNLTVTTLSEDGTLLTNKYMQIGSTANDASRLGGELPSKYARTDISTTLSGPEVTVENNLTINGNLTVTGTTTTVNTTEVAIGDNIMTLNADEVGVPSQNAGIEIERGTEANVSLLWNEATDQWDFGNRGVQGISRIDGPYGNVLRSVDEWLRLNHGAEHTSGVLTDGKLRADGGLQVGDSGSVFSVNNALLSYQGNDIYHEGNKPTPADIGALTVGGEASTATKLATARTIALNGDITGSASFDGSGNITISAVVADDSHNHTVANVDGLQVELNGKASLDTQQNWSATQYFDAITYIRGASSTIGLRIENDSITDNKAAIRFRNKTASGANQHVDIASVQHGTGTDQGAFVVQNVGANDDTSNIVFSASYNGECYVGAPGTNKVIHEGNLEAQKVSHHVVKTSNSGALNANKFNKFASITISTQYGDVSNVLSVLEYSDSYPDMSSAQLELSVKHQGVSGTDPGVHLRSTFATEKRFEVGYVIVKNTFPSKVDFYIKFLSTHQTYGLQLLNKMTTGGSGVWFSDQAFVTEPVGYVKGLHYKPTLVEI